MPAVVDNNEVYLFGTHFPVTSPVLKRTLMQPWGGRIVTGDPTRSDQQVVSEHILSDWRGGMLVKEVDERSQPDRWWTGDALCVYKDQMTPPFEVTNTGKGDATGSPVIYAFLDDGSDLFACFDTVVKKFDNTTGAWGATLVTLTGAPYSAALFGSKRFFFTGNEYDYSADGTTWSRVSVPGRYACIYDNRLVTIDNTGQIRWSMDGTTWYHNVKLPLANGSYNSIRVYWNLAGEPSIYVGTTEGVWIVDFWQQECYPTVLEFAPSDYGGRLQPWKDGYLYVSDGLGVHRFNGTTTAPVGLDRDDGLPLDLRGAIVSWAKSPNWLIAVLDATTVTASDTDFLYFGQFSGTDVFSDAVGYSAILAWNGVGWHILYLSDDTNTGSRVALFSTVHSQGRLWFGADGTARYMVLPEGLYNPLEDPDASWALTANHEESWFDAGFSEAAKIAVSMKFQGVNLSATNYITVYYATDDANTWTQFTTLTEDDPDEVSFGGGAGLQFYKMRWKFAFTGDSATLPPVLKFGNLRYIKTPKDIWAFTVSIDCTRPHNGLSARELIRRLHLAAAGYTPTGTTKQLGQFTYREGDDATETYWVKFSGEGGQEWLGDDRRGVYSVTLVVP